MIRRHPNRVVDLQARGQFANATAAFMREETKSGAYDEAVESAWDQEDDSLFDIASELWSFYDDFVDHNVSVSPEAWEYMRRLLAFLRTDYVIQQQRVRIWHPGQLVALGCLVMLTVGCIFWRSSGQWAFCAIAWVAAGLLGRYGYWVGRRAISSHLGEAAFRFAPFLSEKDWRAHERLLEEFRIPPYRPEQQSRWKRSRFDEAVLTIQQETLYFVFLPLILLYRLWPDGSTWPLRETP